MPITTKDGIYTEGPLLPGPGATLGDSTHKWTDAHLNNARVGDVTFENGWRLTEAQDGSAILLVRPNGTVAHRWD